MASSVNYLREKAVFKMMQCLFEKHIPISLIDGNCY